MTSHRMFRIASVASLLLTSCGLDHAMAPAAPTKFLTSTGTDTSSRIARLPFEHSWRDPSVRFTDYKYIVVRPVTTKYLHYDEWECSKSAEIQDRRTFTSRADALARHFTRQLHDAFSDPLCIYYKTEITSRPKTLILEVALTDVHFPNPDTAQLAEIPVCGFEARIRDSRTGKLVATVADRRGPDLHLSEDGTHFTDNEEICSIWATQLMKASNKEIYSSVRRNLITIEDEGDHQ